MNDETEAWHLADIDDGVYDYDDYRYAGLRSRKPRLDNSVEAPKLRNEKHRLVKSADAQCAISVSKRSHTNRNSAA